MIIGLVQDLAARIKVELLGEDGRIHSLPALIDTGFNGCLTLPQELIESLRLKPAGQRLSMLADGAIVPVELFLGIVSFPEKQREILVA